MGTPYSISGTFNFVPDIGLAPTPVPLTFAGVFDQEESFKIDIGAAGDVDVPLVAVPAAGAKLYLIKLDAGEDVEPILVKRNGSVTGGDEISAGGFILVSNPTPDTGTTSLLITAASACTVRIWALG